jgi:hypothetical protein
MTEDMFGCQYDDVRQIGQPATDTYKDVLK